MKSNLIIFEDEYSKGDSEELIKGVTIVIDGEFQQIVNSIQVASDEFNSNIDVISKALVKGINRMVLGSSE